MIMKLGDCTDRKMLQLKSCREISRVNRPVIQKKQDPQNSCKASVRQNKTTEVCIGKKTHTNTHSDRSSGYVGQMTSCIGVSPLCCRALLSVGWREGVVSSFSVCTFFCIRWIQSRAHGLGSVFGPRDVHVRQSSLSRAQLERTRAVHVTSHLSEQANEAREIEEGGRGRFFTDLSILAYYL